MKANTTPQINNRLPFLLCATLLATSLLTASCRKTDTSTTAAPVAYIMSGNTAPGSAPQDFYLDGVKLNTSAMAYNQTAGYVSVASDVVHTAQFKVSSTGVADTSLALYPLPSHYYSAFLSSANTIQLFEDGTTIPPTGYASVRLINMSTSLKSGLDFASVAGGVSTVIATNDLYPVASAYSNVLLASGQNTFTVALTGTNNVLLTIPVTLQSGYIYSIVVSGSSSSTLAYNLVTEN